MCDQKGHHCWREHSASSSRVTNLTDFLGISSRDSRDYIICRSLNERKAQNMNAPALQSMRKLRLSLTACSY